MPPADFRDPDPGQPVSFGNCVGPPPQPCRPGIASLAGPVPALRRPRLPGGPQPFEVLGVDDRRLVEQTTFRPFCAGCSLSMVMGDGSLRLGTGALIGRRTVVTAGHNLHDHGRGGKVRQVTVAPGSTFQFVSETTAALVTPFGAPVVGPEAFTATRRWIDAADPQYDYGVLFLGENPALTDAGGASLADPVQYGDLSDDRFAATPVLIVAYSESLPANEYGRRFQGLQPPWDPRSAMWSDAGYCRPAGPRLVHAIATKPGASGAPVLWWPDNQTFVLVGIHTDYRDDENRNSAVRVTSQLRETFDAWRRQNDNDTV
jgi:V8-like Glu-specific endopeptidase